MSYCSWAKKKKNLGIESPLESFFWVYIGHWRCSYKPNIKLKVFFFLIFFNMKKEHRTCDYWPRPLESTICMAWGTPERVKAILCRDTTFLRSTWLELDNSWTHRYDPIQNSYQCTTPQGALKTKVILVHFRFYYIHRFSMILIMWLH